MGASEGEQGEQAFEPVERVLPRSEYQPPDPSTSPPVRVPASHASGYSHPGMGVETRMGAGRTPPAIEPLTA